MNILMSRNKREGAYAGKWRYCRTNGWLGRVRHRRTGPGGNRLSLREWSDR